MFADEINKNLLRKELLLTRVVVFNDSFEMYQSWKACFRHVCNDINISPSEEIDLLIKWLGRDSKKHAIILRSVYKNDPTVGLQSD